MKTNTRHIAAISLLVMAAGFLVTVPFSSIGWVRFLRGGFEAGLVGGLADWFAVTALFRHPLGIPIPHTAILPNNRKRVTKALVSTVENDLLSKQSIRDKLKQLSVTSRLLDGATATIHQKEAASAIVAISDYAVRSFPLERIVPVLDREIGNKLQSIDTAGIASKLLDYAYANNWDGKSLDFVLDFAEEFVNRESTVQQMGAMASDAIGRIPANGLMSFALNAFAGFMSEERLGETIRQMLQAQIWELRSERNSTRIAITETLRLKLDAFVAKPETEEALEQWKADLLSRFDLAATLTGFLEQARERLLAFIHTEAYTAEVVVPILDQAIERVKQSPEQVERIETFIQDKLAGWIESNHNKIGALIEENINKYDNDTLIAMLEDKIGHDLQWIRVNGAICGFGIGLVLSAFHLFVA